MGAHFIALSHMVYGCTFIWSMGAHLSRAVSYGRSVHIFAMSVSYDLWVHIFSGAVSYGLWVHIFARAVSYGL